MASALRPGLQGALALPRSGDREHVLDAVAALEQVGGLAEREATADQRAHGVRPALAEGGEVADRALEVLASGVDAADDDLVLEHDVAHQEVAVDLDRPLARGHAGEH